MILATGSCLPRRAQDDSLTAARGGDSNRGGLGVRRGVGSMRRLAVVMAAVAVLGVLGAAPAPAQTTDAVSVARALIAAENAHDVNTVLNFFAPGAIVNLPT